MKIFVCIPARYASTRFPGKVLADQSGKYLVQHTYEQVLASKVGNNVIIACDDVKIADAARKFGARCILTDPQLASGTDRIAQAVSEMDIDIVINVQADEPEIEPGHIDKLASLLVENPSADMATLVAPFESLERVSDPNMVKVITDSADNAIYFSRSPIPYDRQSPPAGLVRNYLRHLGMYAYRKQFLLELTNMPTGRLESIEKLEQLRAIEAGCKILTAKVSHAAPGIDTPEQYAEFVKRYKSKL